MVEEEETPGKVLQFRGHAQDVLMDLFPHMDMLIHISMIYTRSANSVQQATLPQHEACLM